eukprot:1737319-Amphidinium_carterae.1
MLSSKRVGGIACAARHYPNFHRLLTQRVPCMPVGQVLLNGNAERQGHTPSEAKGQNKRQSVLQPRQSVPRDTAQ